MTTDANRALMERYLAASRAGDGDAIAACLADDVTMEIQGRSRHAGTYRGPDGFRDAVGRISGDADVAAILEVHDVLVSERHAVGLVRERFCRDGHCVDTDRVVVYELRDGHIAAIRTYDSDVYAYDELFPRA